ncbi:Bbp19 family protein [Candidatus Liberibacter brunswickensis]|uniref:Bbp19 family protein n=1 Tax=Candidatus Liberibacter brunswickensis TaxID=1968796 RepID=UPI002FE3DC26
MVDFSYIVEKIKRKANQRGYQVDKDALNKQLQTDERRLRLYKQVFSTEAGKWVLNDLMSTGGLLASFETDSSLHLAHLEGKRAMAVYIASNLGLTFAQVIEMYSDMENDKI